MPLYAFTTFLGAVLLFQVELMLAKYLLPWFGGAPAVWTACMLFFQAMLLAGYAYAAAVATRLRPCTQARLHGALLLAAAVALAAQAAAWGTPLLPGPAWKPSGAAHPVADIAAVLVASTGIPFLLLSSTSTLLQAWLARTHPGRSPYPLYAWSNAGSLLGLAAYPLAVEPTLPLKAQAWVWSGAFVAFAACAAACARRFRRAAPAAPPAACATPPGRAPSPWGLWLSLPACGSLLLLASTNAISEEVAVVPLLWAVPLALYLASFILCFEGGRWYVRPLFAVASLAAMLMVGTSLAIGPREGGLWEQTGVYGFALFVACMICHGELARLKPPPAQLTGFYLCVAAGGALGAAAAGLAAPALFPGLWELYLGYFLCGALLMAAMLRDARSAVNGRWRRAARGFAALAVCAAGVGPFLLIRETLPPAGRRAATAVLAAVRFGVPPLADDPAYSSVRVRRNFYGVLRVSEPDRGDPALHRRKLYHGGTCHGFQFVSPARRREPTAYYTEKSGGGLILLHHPRRQAGQPLAIGAVGLGCGTLAAYGREGDTLRFYEINPAVIEWARDPSLFTFLADTPAAVTVVAGDARLSLEREAPQAFDVLALDAFSGDAVPVHLLTKEAFAVYLRHLRPDGVLAVHISSRYIDLEPVLDRAADALDLHRATIYDPTSEERIWKSHWVLLSRDASVLHAPAIAACAVPPGPGAGRSMRLWTDDYSSVLGVLY